MKLIFQRLRCLFGHDYTCAVEEGVEATTEQLKGGIEGFYDYAKMYCRKCGYVYKPRNR